MDAGGRLELYAAKRTELPDMGDTVNLDFVGNVEGKSRVVGAAVVACPPNGFPLPNEFRTLPVPNLVESAICGSHSDIPRIHG
ncbi:MAG: hypothetical protein ACYCRE_07910 [Acidobacteriaceae bacterium]